MHMSFGVFWASFVHKRSGVFLKVQNWPCSFLPRVPLYIYLLQPDLAETSEGRPLLSICSVFFYLFPVRTYFCRWNWILIMLLCWTRGLRLAWCPSISLCLQFEVTGGLVCLEVRNWLFSFLPRIPFHVDLLPSNLGEASDAKAHLSLPFSFFFFFFSFFFFYFFICRIYFCGEFCAVRALLGCLVGEQDVSNYNLIKYPDDRHFV